MLGTPANLIGMKQLKETTSLARKASAFHFSKETTKRNYKIVVLVIVSSSNSSRKQLKETTRGGTPAVRNGGTPYT